MDKQAIKQKRLKDLASAKDTDKSLTLLAEINDLDEKVDNVKTELEQKVNEIKESIPSPIQGIQGLQGEKGDKGDRGEQGSVGEKGDTIIIEKIIERTEVIKEPIVTNQIVKEIKEIAVTDTPQEIIKKVNIPGELIKKERVEGLEDIEKIAKLNAFNPTMGPSFADLAKINTRIDSLGTGGVTSIVAGTNVTISPISGLGAVTVNATTPDLSAYLKLDQTTPQTVTNQPIVTAVDADYVLINDTSDSGKLKKALKSDFGGSQTPWTSDINGGGFNLTNVGGLTETFAGATQILSFTSPNEYSTSGITVKDNTSTGKAGVQAFWDTNLDPTTETQQDVSTGTVRMSLIPDDGDSTPHFKIEMMAAGGSWGSHITPLDINLNGVFLSGNVGIGVSPSYLLDVNGDVNIASGKYYRYNGAIFSFADTTLHNYFSGGAGNLTATGTDNAGFGPVDYNAYWTTGSLGSLTTGQQNTAIGVVAGAGITTGSYNMVFGYAAMGTANASEDCAIGRLSLHSDTGGYNTGVGNTSLYANTSGSENVAIGKDAGRANTTGVKNTFIGSESGYTDGATATTNNLTNATAIGAYAQVTQSNSLILGGTGTYAVNVGIGKTAPTARLHLPAGTATAGTAPQKFTAGTLLTTPELGALEFVDDGTNGHLYITRNIAGVLTRTLIV